jgi:hypothetical protein
MMWFILQSTIIFAVCASNIHWHWTPNGYIPALLGIGLAYLATLLVQRIMLKYLEVTPNPRGLMEQTRNGPVAVLGAAPGPLLPYGRRS